MVRVVTRGVWNYCGGEYAGSGMSWHLQACQARKDAVAVIDSSPGRKQKIYHLRVSGFYLPEYLCKTSGTTVRLLQLPHNL